MATDPRRPHLPLLPGALAGGAAFLAGYLVTYLSQADRLERAFAGVNVVLDLFGGDGVPAWTAVGWLFYNAHLVDVLVPLPGRSSAATDLVGPDGAPALLYLLPPVLLLLAGVVVGRYAGASDAVAGAKAGLAVVPGYAVLAVLGVVVTRVSVGDAAVGPDPATGVLLAGLVYPAVFGALGGVLAAVAR